MKKYWSMIGNILLYLAILYVVMFSVSSATQSIYKGLEGAAKQWLLANQTIAMVAISILAVLGYMLVFKLRRKSLTAQCKFKAIDAKAILALITISLAMSIFSTSFLRLSLVQRNITGLGETVEAFMGSASLIIALLSAVIIVPAFEEIVFRGLVFNEMKKALPLGAAIVLQSLVFSLYQLNIPTAVFGFVGGILFALAYEWLDSIWASIILQTVSCFFMFMFKRVDFFHQLFDLSDGLLITAILISLAVVIYAALRIKHKYYKVVKANANRHAYAV